ncbi:hypothetical protein [Elizabethkingia anophelis]|uniref:Uncharacterized protein n=1 Tax=Elizabethkingia anophelis TaxID=1117645 RepID=A0AAU8URV0_9FLAO|nr:hypothetical protein [Elizabethkingia anophelis]AQX00479.1 hypothetical protein BBD32_02850 [Elizabethkingia anophelis]OPB66247.1 hypothetical protein BAY11_14880 [Elizabethkingia anophelis]
MEKFLINFNRGVISTKENISNHYNQFLDTRAFWLITFIVFSLTYLYYNIFFYQLNYIAGIIYSLILFYITITFLTIIYYKIKGIDFFQLLEKKINPLTDFTLVLPKENSTNKETPREEVNPEIIQDMYRIVCKARALDITSTNEHENRSYLFSYEYFKNFINDIYINGHTDSPLHLTMQEKQVGYLLFNLFKPVLNKSVKKFSDYILFCQSKGFSPVNYDCIDAPSKRHTIKGITNDLVELKKKVMF